MGRELLQRVFLSAIAIILLIVCITLAPLFWFRPIIAVLLAILASVGLWEFYRLARLKGIQTAGMLGILGTWFYMAVHYVCVHAYLVGTSMEGITSGIAFGFLLLAFILYYFPQIQGSIESLSTSVFGFLYIPISLAFALDIFYCLPVSGRFWISFIIATTVATDMGAYFTGKAVGCHKLAPELSPGKTIEGGIGGLIGGVIAALICAPFAEGEVSWTLAVVLGLIFALFGQFGDLLESLFKRDAGVKDSNSLPGLGGVLDVCDSLFINLPLGYALLRILFPSTVV